jgi:hypothetical protein
MVRLREPQKDWLSSGPSRVFISYSHRDEAWRAFFAKHLNVLASQGIAEVWTALRIGAGEAWEREIIRAIDSARLAILLISADFLGSEFILNVEIPQILERHRAGELAVVPVLVRPCPWEAVPWLREIQMRPWDGTPLSSRNGRREAEVVKVVREILGMLKPRLR